MGGWIVAAFRNLAEKLAAVDRGRPANRREHRNMLACLTVYFMASQHPRFVFSWEFFPRCSCSGFDATFRSRRNASREAQAHHHEPGVIDLVSRRRAVEPLLLTIVVCATSLSAWWHSCSGRQRLRNPA